MPGAVQNAGDGGQGQQRAQPSIMSSLMRMFFMWWVLSFIRGTKPPGPSRQLTNSFSKGESVDLTLYISDEPWVRPKLLDSEPLFELEDLGLATHPAIAKNLTVELTEGAKRNGSLYLHAFYSRHGYTIGQHGDGLDEASVFHGVMQMNQYMPKRKKKIQKNLLSAKESEEVAQEEEVVEEEEEEGNERTEIISYWKSPITLAVIDDFSKYSNNSIPPHFQPLMHVHEEEDTYSPMIFFNEFWVMKERMAPLNESIDSVTLEVSIRTLFSQNLLLV